MSPEFESRRIPPEIFEQARLMAARERAKAMASFFSDIARLLGTAKRRRLSADMAFRFQNHGLWRGI